MKHLAQLRVRNKYEREGWMWAAGSAIGREHQHVIRTPGARAVIRHQRDTSSYFEPSFYTAVALKSREGLILDQLRQG